MHGIECADNIWFTCCALHNMLLHVDGLDKKWKKGVKSPFQGELGWHASGDVETYAPLIFRRVNDNSNPDRIRTLDLSSIHNKPFGYEGVEEFDGVENANYKILKMTNKMFRDKLITHVHKRWELNDIVWPSRTGKMKA